MSERVIERFEIEFAKDNDIVKQTLVYDYNRLSLNRILRAEQLFLLNNDVYQKHNAPGTDEQFQTVMAMKTEQKALAALLMKVDAVKSSPTNEVLDKSFDVDSDFSYLFDSLTGEDYERLHRCRNDFFSRSKTLPKASTQELKLAVELLKELGTEQVKSLMSAVGVNSEPELGKM